jgi:LysM repeat protein
MLNNFYFIDYLSIQFPMNTRLIFTLAVAFVFIGCGEKKPSYEDFLRAQKQINEKQQEILKQSDELSKIIKEVNAKYPDQQIKLDSSLGLSPEQEKKLSEIIQKESDISTKTMLQKLIDADKKIEELNQQIKSIEEKLPKPYVVKKGDATRKVAMDYLMDIQKLSKEEAKKLVDQTGLFDEIVPGNYIYLYYNDGVFGAFVTQGTAKYSPQVYKRAMREKRETEAYERGLQEGQNAAFENNRAEDK